MIQAKIQFKPGYNIQTKIQINVGLFIFSLEIEASVDSLEDKHLVWDSVHYVVEFCLSKE